MKIDLEVYRCLIDLRRAINSNMFQIQDIESMGIDFFLDMASSMDFSVYNNYKNLCNSINNLTRMVPGTKFDGLKSLVKYSSVKEMKDDLFVLPSVSHERKSFEELKSKMKIIYEDNPDILYDITDHGGLIKTINGLVEKYNKNENQNV